MNRTPHILSPSVQVVWGTETPFHPSSQELRGYESLANGKLQSARDFFDFAIMSDPLCAFRISQACVQAGAYGLAQRAASSLAAKVDARPDLGAPDERLRSIIDCLTIPLVSFTTAQLLQMDASEWSYLAKYPRALEKLASEKMDFLDFIFSYLQSSYEFAPVTTLRLLWLLASFGLLEERRHQESLQALFYDKRNTEVDETLSPENSKAVNELREKVLCAISQNKKNNGSIDAQDAVEKTRPQSEDEARSPLLAAFASPQKKNWLRSRLPFPAS